MPFRKRDDFPIDREIDRNCATNSPPPKRGREEDGRVGWSVSLVLLAKIYDQANGGWKNLGMKKGWIWLGDMWGGKIRSLVGGMLRLI